MAEQQGGLLSFLNSAAGQGLLSAVGSGLLGARRGAPLNAIGAGLLGGVQGYAQAQDNQIQQQRAQSQDDWFKTQREWMMQDRARMDSERQRRENFLSGALAPQPILQQSQATPDLRATNPYTDPNLIFQGAKNAGVPGVDQVQMGIKPISALDAILAGYDPEQAAQLQSLTAPKQPRTVTLKPGETVFNQETGAPLFSAQERETPTELARLTRELQSLPPNSPLRGVYINAIQKATSHAPGTSVSVNTRQENEFSKDQGKQFSEMLSGINKAGFAAPAQLRKLERLEQLLNGVDGGKLSPVGLEVASALNSLGIKVDPKLGNKEAAEALSREIAGGFRQPGSGPMTDKDFENFLLQVPSLSKSAQGRKQITATMRAALNRDIELSRRAREYVRRNGQLDNGYLDDAAQFIAENPVVGNMSTWKVQR